jgi:hypothetical protein
VEPSGLQTLAPYEVEQIGVNPILVRGRQAVRRARIVDFLRALDQLGRLAS